MLTVNWQTLSEKQQANLLSRPAINASDNINAIVTDIIANIRSRGDEALIEYTKKFDQLSSDNIQVSQAEVDAASARLDDDIKQAIDKAYQHIRAFHQAQIQDTVRVETMPGVVCEMHTQAIESVGLYIPGGSAPLPSTVLMVGAPAQLAGCKRLVLCSPPPLADEILYAAKICGVDEIFTVGGAQAVAAMAYGTQSIAKVNKIFGPGNAFVTEAKRQVSMDFAGAAIDMPAGPSEVLVLADDSANPEFIASDLLSQAEHGHDSQAVLVTTCPIVAEKTAEAVLQQVAQLSRREIAEQALGHSMIIIAESLDQAVEISNTYAPEHLIVQTREARSLIGRLLNAGSIFLGPWTPESVGDYASGTNHVLPTYGYTKTYSSLGMADFVKRYTVQELTADGLQGLGATVTRLADAEGLDAHKRAVTIRLQALEGK